MRTIVRKYWTLVSGARISESGLCTNVGCFLDLQLHVQRMQRIGKHGVPGGYRWSSRGRIGRYLLSKINSAKDHSRGQSLEFQTERKTRCAPRTGNATDSGWERCGGLGEGALAELSVLRGSPSPRRSSARAPPPSASGRRSARRLPARSSPHCA